MWDAFWMLSALWVAPIVLWLAHGYADPESSPLDVLYFGLTALFWIGHRLCSTYVLTAPTLIAHFCGATCQVRRATAFGHGCMLRHVSSGDLTLPWTREERFVALAIADTRG